MATNFPTSLDSLTNPTATDTLDSPPHDTQHADANDAIEALQAKVGIDSSAVTTSLDYKVGNLESRPVETKTASYTLVATDVNKRIVMNSAGATTITVNDGVFAAGDTVWIHNIGAGTATVTAGTATVNTAGSLDVGQWEGGSLYFTSASSAIFFRGGGAVSAANFTDTATGTYSSGGKNYKYLTFTASGTLTVDTGGLVDILMIGGGGGGGDNRGGGGGAGGMWETTGAYLPAGTHTVVIGAGGAGGTRTDGKDGLASRIADYWMPGGGAGTAPNGGTGGHNGASGGGGSYQYGSGGGTGISGLGNNGGSDTPFNSAGGGGGGGAGAAGSNGSNENGGNGGAGRSSSITGTAVTYAGGGGGGGANGKNKGSGGSGGGGAGNEPGGNGTANTGSGGGGGHGIYSYGGNGASGLVVVRVEV